MSDLHKKTASPAPQLEGQYNVVEKPSVIMNDEISKKVLKMTDKLGNAEVELAIQVKQAREFMDWSVNHMKRDWFDWSEASSKAIREAQMARMAIERESKALVTACADVRDFFGSPEHEERTKKIKEFVEVCERLKALKDSGFLDSIADTILKLS